MKGMVDGFGNDVGERGFRRPERAPFVGSHVTTDEGHRMKGEWSLM
jgi:hypothetical protein